MFCSARWKAYLRDVQAKDKETDGRDKGIYHIFHSQKLWFTRDDAEDHQRAAEEHLKRCDVLLAECSAMLDDLEETLANTPKPSEVLDWCWF